MKTTRIKTWLAVCASVLAATAMFRASAEQAASAAKSGQSKPDKYFTGTVVSVNPDERVVGVKDWWPWKRTFNLGNNCAISQLNKGNATAGDLRPGEKVTVAYQDVHGVRIADRVEQDPMRFKGMVKSIDVVRHTMVLHRPALDKELQLPDNCKIVLHDGRIGTLADIKVGNHVMVTYELPNDTPTAHEISQTSLKFTGTMTAIDLDQRTIKAKTMFTTKKFNLGDNCVIVINGKPDGSLADLRPDEKLTFSYDEIHGINVVNRIAPADTKSSTVAANSPGN